MRVRPLVVCNTAKVRFFKQITTYFYACRQNLWLFAIQQKYDFSSKSQRIVAISTSDNCCLQYSKSTIFQANHNIPHGFLPWGMLFAIQQKYNFSSKSQPRLCRAWSVTSCLQYSKSTIFQANHNTAICFCLLWWVVCNTAKVRFFKQITTIFQFPNLVLKLFAILQKYDFSSKSQPSLIRKGTPASCLQYCKSTIFQANHN